MYCQNWTKAFVWRIACSAQRTEMRITRFRSYELLQWSGCFRLGFLSERNPHWNQNGHVREETETNVTPCRGVYLIQDFAVLESSYVSSDYGIILYLYVADEYVLRFRQTNWRSATFWWSSDRWGTFIALTENCNTKSLFRDSLQERNLQLYHCAYRKLQYEISLQGLSAGT
jgi:hypothetical protein